MKITRVYVNAGHNEAASASGAGRYEPGAVGVTGLHEATVTLDVAQRVKGGLTVERIDARGAVKESFIEGTRNANACKADLCISIHCNAATARQAHGIEVVVADEGNKPRVAQARVFLEEIRKAAPGLAIHGDGIYGRPVKILADTTMPALLMELGFVSNPQDEAYLKVPENRQRLANGIVAAVLRLRG